MDDLPTNLSFIALYANGNVVAIQGYPDKAKQIIEQAVQNSEKNGATIDGIASAYFSLAGLYMSGGRGESLLSAPEDFDWPTKLEDLDLDNPLSETSREDVEKAVYYYDQVIYLGPNFYTENGVVFWNRAVMRSILNDWDGALQDLIEFYNKIAPNDAPDAKAYYFRGILRLVQLDDPKNDKEKNHPSLAIDDFTTSMKLGKKLDCDLAWELSNAYLKRTSTLKKVCDPTGFCLQGINVDDNIKDYTQVIELQEVCNSQLLQDNVAVAYWHRGFEFWLSGDYQNSISDFKNYLRLKPSGETSDQVREIIKSQEEALQNHTP